MDKRILQRYVDGNVTADEIEMVVDWLDEDESHVREFMALHKLHDIALLNQSRKLHSASNKNKRFSLRKVAYELAKVAAVFLILWGGMRLFDSTTLPQEDPIAYQTLYVPAGQRAELLLPDSTRVWVNAHSKLVYPVTFEKGVRQVELSGEAYFEVAHNKECPFVVKTSQIDIEVLGTEFNVTAYNDSSDFKVSLVRGCIELQSPRLAQSYRMNEKEHATLREGKLVVTPIPDYDYFKWKDGLICFNDESVATIIEKLELYYDTRIEVHNQRFLKSRYSGKFRTKDGIEQVLKVLQIEHKFSYTKNNDLNLITIK